MKRASQVRGQPRPRRARAGGRALGWGAGGLWLLACSSSSTSTEFTSSSSLSPFRKVTLDAQPGEPIGLAVLPDGSVLHTTRGGEVWFHEAGGSKVLSASLAVYSHDEEGLQSIAIDPDFTNQPWVYLYYSPPLATPRDDPSTPDVDEGAAPVSGSPELWAPFQGVIRLSRFRFSAPLLDVGSEQILLEVPVDRGICCHVGGHIDFDGAGDLYLSTGDDTNPFESQGYAPIDERPDRHPAFDAQRSAANTNDLRGKLLRIRVQPDGSYTIPEGNLFAPGTPFTRPEIYAMGLRNPFRFSIRRSTGEIYLGDYSPDARDADPRRGPAGTAKWVVLRQPANYGWPYCVAPGQAYVAFDFATSAAGQPFDCTQPTNRSPRNTGLEQLPAVSEPDLAYSYGPHPRWPELGIGGVGPMGGPAYEFDPARDSLVQWPVEYAGVPLFYEWTRDLVFAFHRDGEGRLSSLEHLSFSVDNPIDMEFGPDGALYVLEYGDGYYSANPEAQLARIEYVGNREAQNSSPSQ